MRWLVLLLVLLAAAPAPAGAVVFEGREGWQYQGALSFLWSVGDFGYPPPPVFYPPCAGLVSDTTVSSAIDGFVPDGEVGATLSHHLAPLGPLSLVSPLCTYDLHTWSSSGGLAGRYVIANDVANLYLEPALIGESLYVLVHWHVTAYGPPGSHNWNLAGPSNIFADQDSGPDGYARQALQGPDWRDYLMHLRLSGQGGLGASEVGTEDMVLHLDVYASDSPVTGVEPSPAPAGLALSAPAPNPVRDAAAFTFDLPRRGGASLEVMDLAGRVVRGITLGELDAGRHSVSWDRRNDRGAPVAPGVYWARLGWTQGGRIESRGQRIVVLE